MIPIFEEEGHGNSPQKNKGRNPNNNMNNTNNTMELSFKLKIDGVQSPNHNGNRASMDGQKNSIKISYLTTGNKGDSSYQTLSSSKSVKSVRLNPIKN